MFGLLTQSSIPIIGFCAKILGVVMRYLYLFLDKIGIANIGIAIILFTLIVKLLMFPLTLKQQKFSKLSNLMNPELQAIQKKYRNKRDNESMMKQQEEMNAVYKKYGTSPSGSCLQLLIQMPILFSLYYVISGIPAYVPEVKNIYEPISTVIVENYDNFNYMEDAYVTYIAGKDEKIPEYVQSLKNVNAEFTSKTENKVIDVLARLQNKSWNDLDVVLKNGSKIIDELSAVTDEQWKEMKDKIETDAEKKEFDKFVESIKDGSEDEKAEFEKDLVVIDKNKKKLDEINNFGPLNLSQSPLTLMGWALLIPVLSALTQWLSSFLMQLANKDAMQDNPMNSTMKSMNIIMPLISAVFCLQFPTGLGIYWVCSALFQAIQQFFINIYFNKVDINEIIQKNVEKQKNKKPSFTSRMMEAAYANETNNANKAKGNSIASKAKINTSNIQNGNPKPGSMAEKANMVKKYNEKNKGK